MAEKKLALSATDKKLAGVCGGLAEFFGMDSTLIRIILVCCVIFGGFGILLYLIAWLVMSMSN
jgi:phage shock protein PspC (stress-responsive transcriptional regulator)